MGKKNTKGTQKVNPIMDDSVVPPPYETAFGTSNTEEVKKGKQDKHGNLHSCKCKNKKTNNIRKPTRTWESITNLYGDADTTEVWDKKEQKPKKFFSSIFHKQENPKKTIDKSEYTDVITYPTLNLKHILAKPSHIGLHRKRKKNHNKIKTEPYENENNKDTDVKFLPYTNPKVKFMLSKKPKKGLKDQFAIGDICTEGPCREALENLYNLYGLKYTPYQKYKVAKSGNDDKCKKEKKKTKVPTKENKVEHKNCKCKDDTGITLQTSDNINEDNSKKGKTKFLTKEYKVMKQSKKKQPKAIKIKKDGNVGYGDQISPMPSKKQDLKDVQCKCSFIGKMIGCTNCKCKYDTGITLPTSDNINEDNSKKEKTKTKTLTKEYKAIKKSKKKQAKANEITKVGNVGYGDQISPIPSKKQNLRDVQCKCSFIEKMMRHTICKCKTNTGCALQTSSNINKAAGNPLLEMKVNLTDMRVINSLEVNEKIKKLGKTEKNMSCLCPSRLKGEVCQRGPCEEALENQNTRFDCRCQKQNDIRVECNDSTCDRHINIKSRQKKMPKSKVYKEGEKPLFEVMLDPAEMSVINANEIKDIIGKASQNKIICPTGICNKMAKQRNVQLNCKCVGKKLSPYVNECEERTCRDAKKKCKLSYLCSRVFSKSENWTGHEENRKRWPVTGYEYDTNTKKDDFFIRSHTHYKRNGVMINLPRGQTLKKGGKLSDVWCKCFCECNKKVPKKPSLKKKDNKKVSRRRRKRRGFFRKKKKDHRTLTEKVLDCLDKEQEECEKRVKIKTKEYNENEKKAIKENKKMVAEQKEIYKTRQHQMNCLTNFISGVLNVVFESAKTALKAVFSVILEPISTYIYVKEKIKNPPAAIIRIIEWFIRTWKNKSSAISQALSESATLNVIADHIEDSTVYNALAPKGKTPEERMMYEKRRRVRKRRIQKRNDQALYGCRHMLLTTMRKTPCLWFYHICPDLYPQCLSLTAFMTNFLHVLLYCGAIFCWTPCILACEMCRACMCCLLCTH